MAGLTGKPLLYFTSVFVSLGVFLFGSTLQNVIHRRI